AGGPVDRRIRSGDDKRELFGCRASRVTGETFMNPAIEVRNLSKEFTLHTQGGTVLPVFRNLDLTVSPGECVVLGGPSGVGKSTLIRCMYANYRPTGGTIAVRHDGRPADIVSAPPRQVIDVRRRTLGYVSQFLRTIPRVP